MKNHNTENFREDFERLYNEYAGRLYNYVLRISHGNRYIAEEITQISFVKLWEHRDQISDKEAMVAYLFQIARNVFLNVCEHEAIEYVYQNYILSTQSDLDYSTEHEIDEAFLRKIISELIDEMPPMRRQVFVLSRQYQMSHKQIAEALGISLNTVDTHIMLALHFLRTQLGRRYGVWSALALLLLNLHNHIGTILG